MNSSTIIVAIIIISTMITCIFYVAFGQITVRKLRNNPETKDALGVELASGWDIINVAQAFSLPRSWKKNIENSKYSFMYANATVLYENTTKFDHILGCIFYWLLMISGLSGILLVLLDNFGAFG